MSERSFVPNRRARPEKTSSTPAQHSSQPIAAGLERGIITANNILLLQRQIGNQATQRYIRQPLVTRAPLNRVQRVNFKNPDWGTAGTIKRSGEGAEGVIFVTFGDGQLIVKFIDAPAPAAFAEQMLDIVGVARPQTRFVLNTDADLEGASIRAMVKGKLDTIENEGHQKKIKEQLKDRKWIQVQTVAPAISGAKLNAPQKAAVLEDAQVMQDLGRVAVTDAFMGNYDRISASSINTGNFMIAGVEGPSLVAIDNDASAGKGSTKGARGADLKYIMQPAKVDMLAQMFVMKLTGNGTSLPEGYEVGDVPKLIQSVSGHLQIGIKDGAEKIIAAIQSDKKFFDKMKAMEKGELAGPQGAPRLLLRDEMKARFKLLQSGYIKGGWAKITADI